MLGRRTRFLVTVYHYIHVEFCTSISFGPWLTQQSNPLYYMSVVMILWTSDPGFAKVVSWRLLSIPNRIRRMIRRCVSADQPWREKGFDSSVNLGIYYLGIKCLAPTYGGVQVLKICQNVFVENYMVLRSRTSVCTYNSTNSIEWNIIAWLKVYKVI